MDCGSHNRDGVHANLGGHIVYTWLKLYFNILALIFYKCEGSSQPIEPIKHAKNYVIDIFDYEGHDLWHTRYKNGLSIQSYYKNFILKKDKISL